MSSCSRNVEAVVNLGYFNSIIYHIVFTYRINHIKYTLIGSSFDYWKSSSFIIRSAVTTEGGGVTVVGLSVTASRLLFLLCQQKMNDVSSCRCQMSLLVVDIFTVIDLVM
eukprot:GHVS01084413.1.p1 GENE.GHVS01084413.1~~GHVS01084413.1.p1  ORF type:complete len:110 (-),score=7.47 GHVS01084413.1:134-463(-)